MPEPEGAGGGIGASGIGAGVAAGSGEAGGVKRHVAWISTVRGNSKAVD